jgi:hypothetical protein
LPVKIMHRRLNTARAGGSRGAMLVSSRMRRHVWLNSIFCFDNPVIRVDCVAFRLTPGCYGRAYKPGFGCAGGLQPIGEDPTMETVANQQPGSMPQPSRKAPRRAAERKTYGRSRISNGGDMLPDVDGRRLIVRRYRDIASAILADQGGEDACSESRKQLIRRFAAAAVIAEQMEARLARGEDIDINEHATLSSTLVRLASRIGINRVPKDVTSLDEYLASLKDETTVDATVDEAVP